MTDTSDGPYHDHGLYYTSKTVSDVKKDVERTFGDEADIQISESDIIRWINAAQREILINNRIIKSTGSTDITSGVSEYSLSSLDIVSIQSIHYKGRKLRYRSFNEAEEYIQSCDPLKTNSGDPALWYEWGGVVNLYPVPNESISSGLVVYYIREPHKVSDSSDKLTVPDSYYENVLQFVMSKAYELDEDMENHNMKLTEFRERIGILAEQDADNSQDFYPRITVLQDDSW